MGGVATKRYMPLPPCSRLTFVCQTPPLDGEHGIITRHSFTMQRAAEENLITSCTCIIMIVGHTTTLSFLQKNKLVCEVHNYTSNWACRWQVIGLAENASDWACRWKAIGLADGKRLDLLAIGLAGVKQLGLQMASDWTCRWQAIGLAGDWTCRWQAIGLAVLSLYKNILG